VFCSGVFLPSPHFFWPFADPPPTSSWGCPPRSWIFQNNPRFFLFPGRFGILWNQQGLLASRFLTFTFGSSGVPMEPKLLLLNFNFFFPPFLVSIFLGICSGFHMRSYCSPPPPFVFFLCVFNTKDFSLPICGVLTFRLLRPFSPSFGNREVLAEVRFFFPFDSEFQAAASSCFFFSCLRPDSPLFFAGPIGNLVFLEVYP